MPQMTGLELQRLGSTGSGIVASVASGFRARIVNHQCERFLNRRSREGRRNPWGYAMWNGSGTGPPARAARKKLNSYDCFSNARHLGGR